MNDKFNTIEAAVLSLLQNDSSIAALVSTSGFHTKILADVADYTDNQLPALAVHCLGFSQGEDPRERKMKTINGVVEITNRGGNLESVDGKVKQIMSLVMDKINDESPVLANGSGLNETVEDIWTGSGNVTLPVPTEDNDFTISGIIEFFVDVIERN